MPDGTHSAPPAALSPLLDRIEDLINRGEVGDALGALERAKQFASNSAPPADDVRKSLAQRTEDQRWEIFQAMAVIAVTRDSIDMDEDCDRHLALDVAYKRLEQICTDLNRISGEVQKRDSAVSAAPEVSHG